ncbi:hypothetical protein ACF0H5_012627 [Mactra antiquata]
MALLAPEKEMVTSGSRKNSFHDVMDSTIVKKRKDSVTPLVFIDFEVEESSKANHKKTSVTSGERVRRFSRRLSLRPPSNVYKTSREVLPQYQIPRGLGRPKLENHKIKCECGRELEITYGGSHVDVSGE